MAGILQTFSNTFHGSTHPIANSMGHVKPAVGQVVFGKISIGILIKLIRQTQIFKEVQMKYLGYIWALHLMGLWAFNKMICKGFKAQDFFSMSRLACNPRDIHICSVRENFEGHAGLRTRKSIWTAGSSSQLLVLTVGTNIILTNYCQSSRTCKCFICQSTPSIACKFRGDCIWNKNLKKKKKKNKWYEKCIWSKNR